MVEIQSNYPRDSDVVVTIADLDKLDRIARNGMVFAGALATTDVILHVKPMVSGPWDIHSQPYLFVAGAMFASAIYLPFSIYRWVLHAHRYVCVLRKVESRFSSELVAVMSAIPIVFCFMPLSYTLDFLAVRSKSAETKTMTWKSLFSKSFLANVFALSVIVGCVPLVYSFVMHVNDTSDPAISLQFDRISTVGFVIALVVGIELVRQINRNLRALARSQSLSVV